MLLGCFKGVDKLSKEETMRVQHFGVSLGKTKPVIMRHLSKDHHSPVTDISVRNQDTIFKSQVEGVSPNSMKKSCIFTARWGMHHRGM